eukprot:scaffold8212_cov649-Pinguiococcus_pyrenoidosus.AAC.1
MQSPDLQSGKGSHEASMLELSEELNQAELRRRAEALVSMAATRGPEKRRAVHLLLGLRPYMKGAFLSAYDQMLDAAGKRREFGIYTPIHDIH